MLNSSFKIACFALLVGCDGAGSTKDAASDTDVAGPEIAGLYRVNGQAKDDACTGNFTETLPIPFFELRANGELVEFYVCRTESDCDEYPDSSRSLTQKKNGDWVHAEQWAAFNDADPAAKYCELNKRVAALVPKADDKVTLESNKFQESFQDASFTSEGDCTALLEDWSPTGAATESQCERIQATKVK